MEEMRILLRNKDKIDPKNVQDYIQTGGYEALKKALSMEGRKLSICSRKPACAAGAGRASPPI